MEKKTIGGFISALRKANGLTQKQLAEKLNVSDKAISRWERDEAMPDLSLIPELAEIFGVTTDEILRGERRNPEATALPSKERSEKQRKRILAEKKTKYQIRSTIAIGIGVLGLIAAAICNFGFLRAYIGFMVGTVFYAAAAVCQIIFIFQNLSGLDEDMITEQEQDAHREHTVKLASISFGAAITLLAVSLPLILFPWDTYQGLNGGSWAVYGLLFAAAGLVVSWVAANAANLVLTKKGFLKATAFSAALQRLRLNAMGLMALIFASLFFLQLAANTFLPNALKKGIHFHDWVSFKAFMETPTEQEDYSIYGNGITFGADIEIVSTPDDSVYYDEEGNVIEEEPTNKIYDHDGKLLCEYYHRNESISSWTYDLNGNGPNITVYTTQETHRVNMIMNDLVNPLFICLYPAAALIIYLVYRYKAKRV